MPTDGGDGVGVGVGVGAVVLLLLLLLLLPLLLVLMLMLMLLLMLVRGTGAECVREEDGGIPRAPFFRKVSYTTSAAFFKRKQASSKQ